MIEELHNLTKGDCVIATDVGQHQMWLAQMFPFERPRSLMTSGGLGTMGYGLPAGIGAKFAAPDRRVVVFSGDGSILMNIQELATAVEHKVDIKVIILNNQYMGMVRQWQGNTARRPLLGQLQRSGSGFRQARGSLSRSRHSLREAR